MQHRNSSVQKLFLLLLSLCLQNHSARAQNTTYNSSGVPHSNSTGDGEIRGGFPIGPLSWYAAFQQSSLVCGAALIHGDIALTAAHCVTNVFPGALRFNSDRRTSGGTLVSVTGGQKHPGWTGSITSNDLAILVLAEFLPLTPVTLNSDGAVPLNDGELMFTQGFGLTSGSSGVSDILLATTIPHLRDCNGLSSFVRERMVCGDSRVTATCGGDSGSPVMIDGTNTQIGINSYSDGGCNEQTVDVYTRVSAYYDWIQQQICSFSKFPPATCQPVPPGSPTPQPTLRPTFSPPTSRKPTCFILSNLPLLKPESGIRNAIVNLWDQVTERFNPQEGEPEDQGTNQFSDEP